ncbi:MAG: metallophosphoesterase family protein [Armatimonadota bacterium]|nr:MAG: metallophosphoesterase family protein [Armatimonadota bacterium]
MTRIPKKRRLITFRSVAALAFVVFLVGFAYGFRFRVRTVRVPAGLPTPVRLVVMSDLHLGALGIGEGTAMRAVAEARRLRPDAIVMVGDLVSSRRAIPDLPAILGGLQASLGVYAVLGNHDHWADAQGVRAALESAGIKVLVNDSATVRKGKTRLAFVGIDDLWAGAVNWDAAWRSVPADVPAVLLSHNPEAAVHPEGQRATLIVSGHTHAGKIRLPRFVLPALERLTGVTPIPATTYGVRHPYGLVREPWGWVYVTSGVAAGASPPRWFTRPEVAVLDLR